MLLVPLKATRPSNFGLLPELDQLSTRGVASAVEIDPSSNAHGSDTRLHRVIKAVSPGFGAT